jgi:SAM-dependent methyltransferase
VDRCLACGGDRVKSLPLRYEFRGSFPLVECRRCGMRFLTVQPAGEGLTQLYSAEYFEKDFRCGRSDAAYSDENSFREENRGLLDDFDRIVPPRATRRLLEVGAAGGWLLKHARERGWTVSGVELSADASARARALGLEVVTGDLESARFPSDTFDLAYMGDVLEHVSDCRATVTEVARVLAPGGSLYVRGPITTNSLARRMGLRLAQLVGREIVLREPPYHLWEFLPGSLRALFERAGLEVTRLEQAKTPPSRKPGLGHTVMAVIDALNVPWTRATGALGDRIVVVARKRD